MSIITSFPVDYDTTILRTRLGIAHEAKRLFVSIVVMTIIFVAGNGYMAHPGKNAVVAVMAVSVMFILGLYAGTRIQRITAGRLYHRELIAQKYATIR